VTTAGRLRKFGQTIFTEMSLLATRHEAINLGQGFPDFDGPRFVKEAASAAIAAGHGQYARMYGIPELNEAVAESFGCRGLPVDPETEVTVTSGCTEALAATFLGLIEPGDEVILMEPYYDAYPVDAALAGAVPTFVTLRPPGFRLVPAELEAAVTERTRAIVVNSPHNPTGRVFDDTELEAIAGVCRRHDLVIGRWRPCPACGSGP
jgi:aspartate/methionine/tyrosine aminotransferase